MLSHKHEFESLKLGGTAVLNGMHLGAHEETLRAIKTICSVSLYFTSLLLTVSLENVKGNVRNAQKLRNFIFCSIPSFIGFYARIVGECVPNTVYHPL